MFNLLGNAADPWRGARPARSTPDHARTGAALAFVICLLTGAAVAGPSPAWVQMVGDRAEARLVTTDPACPAILIDGHARPMTERASANGAFANRVCAASLPARAARASIEGRALPLPKLRPDRIIILGDSGCRLKNAIVQDCNSPSGWPFARIAALAAKRRPDLVVHVGDYYYRETPCPPDQGRRCADSPFGDQWPTWKAELFDPAAPLLASAPWVFTRGNHEDCARGGAGWFRLLDAAPTARTCPARADPFETDIGGVRLLIVDSADTVDAAAPVDKVAAFTAQLPKSLDSRAGEPRWLITHRPIWDTRRTGEVLDDSGVNATQRAAVQGRPLAGVQLVLAGHVHNFTSLDFGPGRPPQLVVGTGGDLMDANDLPPPVSGVVKVDGLDADAFTMGRWGYFEFDRKGAGWVGTFRDLDDRVSAVCRLRGRALTCRAPKA